MKMQDFFNNQKEDFKGFIKVERILFGLMKKERFTRFQAACHLLYYVSSKAGGSIRVKVKINGKERMKTIALGENEREAAVSEMARLWKWDRRSVMALYEQLEELGIIKKRVVGMKGAQKTLISTSHENAHVDEHEYEQATPQDNTFDNQSVTDENKQGSSHENAHVDEHEYPHNTRITRSTNKEEKNSSNFSDDSSSKDSNKKKVARKKGTPNEAIETLLNSFSDRAEIDAIWEDWKEYKQLEYGFKFKSLASEKATLKKLHSLSTGNSETARNIIEEAISNGYKGFFALKPVGGSPASDRGYKGDSESSELNRLYSLKAEEKYKRLNEMNTAFNQSDYETMYGMMSNQGKERFKNGLKTYPKEGMYEALMGKVQEASEGFDETERKYFFYVSENYLRQIGMK